MSQRMDTRSDPTYAMADQKVCPYLGRCDDPDSLYSFPTAANCCHVARPPLDIELPHQETVCLGGDWPACPRYTAALSGEEIRPSTAASRLRRLVQRAPLTWSIVSIVALVSVLLAALIIGLSSNGPASKPSRASSDLATAESERVSSAELTTFSLQSPAPTPTLTGESPIAPPQPSFTPGSSGPASTGGSRTPIPTATQVPTWTHSPTPTHTPSPTPTHTATVIPTWTPTRTPSPTPTRMATTIATGTPSRTLSPTPESTTALPRPTTTLTVTGTSLPAPILLAPSDRQEFSQDAEIILTWQTVGELPSGVFYEVIVAYIHLGETWYDEVPWIQDTSWTLSEHSYLLDLSDDGQFRWSVQVVRQTGADANGNPNGIPLSAPSEVRTLIWRWAPGGGAIKPTIPPPLPPP